MLSSNSFSSRRILRMATSRTSSLSPLAQPGRTIDITMYHLDTHALQLSLDYDIGSCIIVTSIIVWLYLPIYYVAPMEGRCPFSEVYDVCPRHTVTAKQAETRPSPLALSFEKRGHLNTHYRLNFMPMSSGQTAQVSLPSAQNIFSEQFMTFNRTGPGSRGNRPLRTNMLARRQVQSTPVPHP